MAGGSGGPPAVTDLAATLTNTTLTTEFREYLRTKLDRNQESNLDHKKKFEQWLDFVLVCEQIFALPESENDAKVQQFIDIGDRFLCPPPLGYNLALANQLNRRELLAHCKDLKEKRTETPREDLLRPGYEFIFDKLDQKHDLFKNSRPRTPLQAIMCLLS